MRKLTQEERRVELIRQLLAEWPEYQEIAVPEGAEEQRFLLRGLLNVRPPAPVSQEFLAVQDAYLQERLQERGMVRVEDLKPREPGLYLWQGDITRLACDAIVNAANSGLTGCYRPNHHCIDNCIHSFAGVELRLSCAQLMAEQGHPEPTGQAKLTPAFNLPCRYVLHTVGPIVQGPVTDRDRALLVSCYNSCLKLAAQQGLASVAFCCISTGVFHFPQAAAVQLAVRTVRKFLQQESSVKKVIFNVFTAEDYALYQGLLGTVR